MKSTLISDNLHVIIDSAGAELNSVTNKNGLEFIWQAEKEIWPRHAPVLFPIVGKLKNDSYTFADKEFKLSQHGFARDKFFELIQHTESTCVYELRSDDETKKNYPFNFVFQIHYQLEGNTLITKYKVNNPSSEATYFSVGAHPGFTCPLVKEESVEDYYLEFESSQYSLTELTNGLRKTSQTELNLIENKLPLSSTLFDKDALVFENSQIQKITLASKKSEHKIILECKNWPYFGIWSKKACTKFICLEPWYGIADSESSSHEFLQKDGLIKLEPNSDFTCQFSLTFA